MTMTIFFDGLDDGLLKGCDEFSSMGHQLHLHVGGTLPDWRAADIAIFTIGEQRGMLRKGPVQKQPSALRKALYGLRALGHVTNMVDLGHLRPGDNLEATYERIREVCQMLMDSGTLPLIIGASHDLTYGQFLAFEADGRPIALGNIDSTLDMVHDECRGMASHHIYKVLSHTPNFLNNICHLGYQSFLVENDFIDILEKLNFESYRLGQVREGMAQMEPVLRGCDMISFDLGAIRRRDAPACIGSTFYGLTAEEACQLAYYAGWSDGLRSMGFYGYAPALDSDGGTAEMLAAVLWYFLDGFYSKPTDGPMESSSIVKYSVHLDKGRSMLHFFQSEKTERWWMQVEQAKGEAVAIPCSYEDYLEASKGNVPDRLIQAMTRMA